MDDLNSIKILGFEYHIGKINQYDRIKIGDNWAFCAYRVDYDHESAEHKHGWVVYFEDCGGIFPNTEGNAEFMGYSYISAQDAADKALVLIRQCRDIFDQLLIKK